MRRTTFFATLAAIALFSGAAQAADADLARAIAGSQRTADFARRDHYRHPQETLEFFGIRPDMTVVEVWPSGGWWTEILAPYLHDKGKYYAAHFVVSPDAEPPRYRVDLFNQFSAKLKSSPKLYGRVVVTAAGLPDHWELAPPNSADLVLTFRNIHNWMAGGYEREMFAAMFKALKPGGVLGVEEHRGHADMTADQIKESGYVPEALVIQLAELTGFKLVDKSEINANPLDDTVHPKGVWTLPPTLAMGEADKQKWLAIGESDRMTLKFMKPLLVSK
jgi:predicted methyltransferase